MHNSQGLEKVLSLRQEILAGDEKRLKEQRDAGKLTARERIAKIADAGSFVELDALVDGGASGAVTGFGQIDGRSAYASMWKGGTVVLAIDLPKISALRAPGQRPGITFVNVHSSVSMRDPRYLLLAQEISTCPFAGMRIIDISDPARPVERG